MPEPMPSAELILERLEAERARQLVHFESLDAKAGLLLGFCGVLIALVQGLPPVALVAGVPLVAAAAVAALVVLWPRDFPVLEAQRLRQYLAAEQPFTRLVLIDTTVAMTATTSRLLARKASALRSGLALLLLAVLILGTGVIVGPR